MAHAPDRGVNEVTLYTPASDPANLLVKVASADHPSDTSSGGALLASDQAGQRTEQ